jgi:hypothetical protein
MTHEERGPGLVPVRIGERRAQAVFWTVLLVVGLLPQAWMVRHWPAGWLGATFAACADGSVVGLLVILASGHWSRYAAGLHWLRDNERYKAEALAFDEVMRQRVARDPALRAKLVAALEAYRAEIQPIVAMTAVSAVHLERLRAPANENWAWTGRMDQASSTMLPIGSARMAGASVGNWRATAVCVS